MTYPQPAASDSGQQRPNEAILRNLQAGRFGEELPGLRRRLVSSPDDHGASYLYALASAGTGGREAERRWMTRALVLAPDHAHIRTSLGVARLRDGDIDGALADFDRTLKTNPNFAAARYNRAIIHLEATRFARGWADYEWRFSYPAAPGEWRDFPSPVWDGVSPIDGKLLVWVEQSISAQILFASVYTEFEAPGGLIVEADSALVPLLRRVLPKAEVIAASTPPDARLHADDIAAQIPMGRLCGLKRRSIADFRKAKRSFLIADGDRALDLMLDLVKPEKHTIGLAWRSQTKGGARLTLDFLEPVLKVPDITWVSLEDESAVPEIRAFEERTGIKITTDHEIDVEADLDGLAALITACDLTIAVDKPVAHLAGALGRSVWTLLPNRHEARWYWFSGHHPRPIKFSRWYPAMRLVWRINEESPRAYVSRLANLVAGAAHAAG